MSDTAVVMVFKLHAIKFYDGKKTIISKDAKHTL